MKDMRSENLSSQIASELGERIIRMELKPGERIVEARLSRELGVSRSPIREALRILSEKGLVELQPRHGARVSEMTAESVKWLDEVLSELLGLISRLAAQRRTEETIKPVAAAVRYMEECAEREDVKGYLYGIIRFGMASCQAGGNRILTDLILYLWPVTSRILYASLSQQKSELRSNVKFFRLLLRCYREGDGENAAAVAREMVDHDERFALKAINGLLQGGVEG
jgi:DNA-binding GntR family transcriptional regulator